MPRMCLPDLSRHIVVWCLLLLPLAGQAAEGPARYAYTVNGFDNSLAGYRIDAGGMLHFNGHWPVPSFPAAVGVHPSGRFVLTASKAATAVGVYRIDPATGAVHPVPGSPFATRRARSPFFITFHPSGRFVYVASRFDGVIVFRMDADSGRLTQIDGSPFAAGKRTRSLAVHPSGRFIYASNAYSNSISAYRVDSDSGRLSPVDGAPFSTGDLAPIDEALVPLLDYPPEAGAVPYYLAMHPSGRYLYVANWGGGSLSAFHIDEQTGRLSALSGSPLSTHVNPYAVAAHPSGNFVYALSWGSDGVVGYRVAPGTGELTQMETPAYPLAGKAPVAMRFSADGRHAYVANFHSNNVSVLDVDPNTGALMLRDTVQTRSGPWSIALAPGLPPPAPERAIALSADGVLTSLRQQPADGQLRPLARQNTGARPAAVVVSRDGRFAYLADPGGDRVLAYRIDAQGGEPAPVPGSPFAAGRSPRALTLDINGRYLYVLNTGADNLSVYAVDEDSGALTPTRGSPYRTGRGPTTVAVDAAGRYALVLNTEADSISVFRYMTNLSPLVFEIAKYGSPFATGKRPLDIAIDPSGKHAYVANAGSGSLSLFSIDVQSGVLRALAQSPLSVGGTPAALAMHPSGDWLCVLNRDSHELAVYRRDRVDGGLRATGQRVAVDQWTRSLVWGGQGRYLYLVNDTGRAPARFEMAPDSGALTPAGAANGQGWSALAWPVFSR